MRYHLDKSRLVFYTLIGTVPIDENLIKICIILSFCFSLQEQLLHKKVAVGGPCLLSAHDSPGILFVNFYIPYFDSA
jgi:hypothetical protein